MRLKSNSGYSPPHRPGRFTQHGITLIEVMIVVVMVGILAAIAYPSYQDQVRRSRRSEGKTFLLEAQAREERLFTENNTYTNDMTALSYGSNPQLSENGWYSVAATTPTTTTFTLTATAVATGPQANDSQGGTACNVLSLNAVGQKTPASCW